MQLDEDVHRVPDLGPDRLQDRHPLPELGVGQVAAPRRLGRSVEGPDLHGGVALG
jgi:hypothetical protein